MNDEQRFKKYLQGIKPAEVESPHHRISLRRDILDEIERRHTMKSNNRPAKLIYGAVVLICISAIAFASAALLQKWRFVEEKDGIYTYESEPEIHSEVTETPSGGERREDSTHVEGIGIRADSQADAEQRLAQIVEDGTEDIDVAHRTVRQTKKVIHEGPIEDAEVQETLHLIQKLRSDEPFSEDEALALLNRWHIGDDFSGEEALDVIETLRREGKYSNNGVTVELAADGIKILSTQQHGSESEEEHEVSVKRVIISGDGSD